MSLVFTHMPGESYSRWLGSLLCRDIFQVLINSLVGWFDKLKHQRKFMYLILYPQVQSMQESSTGDPRTRLCSPVNCVGVHVKSWQYSINMDHFYYTTYQLLTCYGWKSFSLSPEICILDLLKLFSSCFHVNEPQILPHIEHQAEKARCNTDAVWFPGMQVISLPLNFQCRLLWCYYSPHVQSQASAFACMLQIHNTGSHTIAWTHKNTAHSIRSG